MKRCLILLPMLVAVSVARVRAADEGNAPTLKIRNDLGQTIEFYLASEKNQREKPWKHLALKPDETVSIPLDEPDRYFVVLKISTGYSRSKPLELRTFVAKYPDYVMMFKDYRVQAENGSGHITGAEIAPERPLKSGEEPERVEFDHFISGDPAVWKFPDR